jgi:hypothetical protein
MAFLYRLISPRPAFPQDMTAAEGEVMQRHGAYWHDLLGRGVAVAYGPVFDPAGAWGLGLLEVDDEPAARAVGDGDPAVTEGVCTYEVVPMRLVRPPG